MKGLISTCLLIFSLCFKANAQPYFRLPPHGAVWQLEQRGYVPPTSYWIACFLKYTNGLDTIQGYPVVVLADSAGYDHFNGYSQNYIYEDSTGKGYMISTNPWIAPDLVWDYGAVVGQTYTSNVGLAYTVDSIDTVTYADNVARKRLFVTCGGCCGNYGWQYNYAIWVEGMGDILNGPMPLIQFESSSKSICYSEHGTVLTLGSTPAQCPANCQPWVSAAEATPLRVEVYPQPAQGSLNLRTDGSAVQVHLLDLNGRRLADWELAGGREFGLSLPQVVPGLYLLEVRDEAGRMVTRRVRLE